MKCHFSFIFIKMKMLIDSMMALMQRNRLMYIQYYLWLLQCYKNSSMVTADTLWSSSLKYLALEKKCLPTSVLNSYISVIKSQEYSILYVWFGFYHFQFSSFLWVDFLSSITFVVLFFFLQFRSSGNEFFQFSLP